MFTIGDHVQMFPNIPGVIVGADGDRYVVRALGTTTKHKVHESALLPAVTVDFPAGSTIYVVDETGATFVVTTAEGQAALAADEIRIGQDNVTTFTCTAPSDMTADEAAEYACTHGSD